MAYLYLDSSDHLVLGLLDSKLSWLEYADLQVKKSSALIHGKIHELLEKHQLNWKGIEGVFHVAGPGSYTGMRLSEGMVQVLQWQGIPIYSFYHFEVPKLLEVSEGMWISNAFKGELFVYQWQGDENETLLVKEESFSDVKKDPVYSAYEKLMDLDDVEFTGELISSNPEKLFRQVRDRKVECGPYYYRAIETEFKKGVSRWTSS